MSDKYQNKYRIASTRLQNWDYGWEAAYFITICTGHRKPYFGNIQNGTMILSHTGVLADVFWHEIKNHAKNVELGPFVVMPNHIHGIVILNGNGGGGGVDGNVETTHALSLPPQQPSPKQTNKTIGQQRFQNQGKNTLSSILGGYKSAVSKHARRLGYEFAWQSRFYDHIIRNDQAYDRIANYIETNVVNWENDTFYRNPQNQKSLPKGNKTDS